MAKDKKNLTKQLAEGSVLPLLIRLAIPATMAQLVNALYSIVDRMYIGHLPGIGTVALAGVGLTFPITMMISAFASMPGMGGAPLASIAMGEGDMEKARRCLNNAALLLLFIAALITVSCLAFLRPLLTLFGADSSTMPYAYSYLKIYLIGTVFVELALGLNPFINTQGFLLTGTFSVVIGATLNIILDPVFMYVFDMGVRGAAIATIISQFVSCLWIICFLSSAKSNIRLSFKALRPHWYTLKRICALGISPCTFRINESLVTLLLNRLILLYGGSAAELHLASMTILNSVGQVFFMPLLGIVNGAQPILSYNFGAHNYPRIRKTIHYARILSFSCAVIMWAVMVFLPRGVCLLFTDETALTELTVITMRTMFCTVFFLGFQMINQNAFIAMGNTKYSFFFGILRKLILLVPLACILPMFVGIYGIYAAEAISNPVTTIITFIVFERFMRNIKNGWAESEA